MPAECRLRLGRRSIPQQAYLVTFTTCSRTPHFSDFAVAASAARLLTEPAAWTHATLLAWVLMPDHWHGVLVLREATLSAVIGHLKGRSARLLRQEHPWLGRIWSGGFHDRALRREEALAVVARYVVLNPVRAGLASRVGDYPFWDVAWLGDGNARG